MAPTHALDGYSFACSRLKLPVDQDMVSSAKGVYAMTSGGGVWAVEVGGAGLRRHLPSRADMTRHAGIHPWELSQAAT